MLQNFFFIFISLFLLFFIGKKCSDLLFYFCFLCSFLLLCIFLTKTKKLRSNWDSAAILVLFRGVVKRTIISSLRGVLICDMGALWRWGDREKIPFLALHILCMAYKSSTECCNLCGASPLYTRFDDCWWNMFSGLFRELLCCKFRTFLLFAFELKWNSNFIWYIDSELFCKL